MRGPKPGTLPEGHAEPATPLGADCTRPERPEAALEKPSLEPATAHALEADGREPEGPEAAWDKPGLEPATAPARGADGKEPEGPEAALDKRAETCDCCCGTGGRLHVARWAWKP